MGIVVLGAVFVDIKGYPTSTYIPGGRNVGRVEQVPGGVSRNVVEDIANVELRPTFVSLVDDTGRVYLDADIGFGLVHTLDVGQLANAVEQGLWQPQEVLAGSLPERFGYVPSPAAEQGLLPKT